MDAQSTVKARSGPAGVARPAGRRVRELSLLVAAFVALLCAALLAPRADAASSLVGYRQVSEFAAHGKDGTMIHHQRIAVDGTSGNLLVVDSIGNRVNVYSPNSIPPAHVTSFGAGTLDQPFGIAVDDSTGAVYVSDAGNDRIVRYVSDGGSPPTYTLDGTFTSPALGNGAGEIGSFAAALAVDRAAGRLLVADPGNNLVKRYRLDGTYDGLAFDGAGSDEGAFTGLLDLAVDSTGDVVVIDSTGDPALGGGGQSRVLRFSSGGTYEARIGASLVTPATVAVRPGGDEVVVSTNQDSYTSGVDVALSIFDADGAPLFEFRVPVREVYGVISGVAAGSNRLYVATDVDRVPSDPGNWGWVSLQAYDALVASPPTVEPPPAFASAVEATTATLNATITPNNAPSTFYFEYGQTSGVYTTRTAVAPLRGSGSAAEAVSAAIGGLTPQTPYYFRVVGENRYGAPSVGSEQTFVTPPLPATVVVGGPTNVTRDSATLHATIDTNGAPAGGTYRFTVVEVGGLGSRVLPAGDVPTGAGPRAVSATVSGLEPGRSYNVGLWVDNTGGISYGEPATFSTVPNPPFVPPTPRPIDNGASPYGCNAPRLDPFRGTARPGQTITLTGADLGVSGTVTLGGRELETSSYASDRISVVLPDDVRGQQQLQVNCGKSAGEVAITISPPPSNRITVPRPSVRGTVATFRVRVPGAGRLSLSGRNLARASARASRAGTVTVRARLTRAGRRALSRARGRRLRVTAVIRFAPTGGTASTVRKAIVFRR